MENNFSFPLHAGSTADFFLFIGQSNMAGRASVNSRHPESAPECLPGAGYEFRAVSDPTRLYIAAEPFGYYENQPNGIYEPHAKTGSLCTSFINAYHVSTAIPVIGLSASRGGSSITEWMPGTAFMEDVKMRLSTAFGFFQSQKYSIRHRYMLWCQGETDGKNQMPPDLYKKCFYSVLTALMSYGIEHCFMIRIGCYNPDAADADVPLQDYSKIQEAQEQIASENPHVTMVSLKFAEMLERGLMSDTYHYFQQAYNEVGTDAGRNTAAYVLLNETKY